MDTTLASLLLGLNDLSEEEAEEKTFQEYINLYMDRETYKGMIGVRKTHDDQPVTFYEDRFEHAFFTSAYKTSRQYNKGKFDRDRASRIRWIGEVIQGNIKGAECWHIPDFDGYHRGGKNIVKRLYVVWDENYMIWLEPLRRGGWRFSTAYVTNKGKGYIRRITSRGWRKKISRD